MGISSRDLIYNTALQFNTSESAEFFKDGEVKYIYTLKQKVEGN